MELKWLMAIQSAELQFDANVEWLIASVQYTPSEVRFRMSYLGLCFRVIAVSKSVSLAFSVCLPMN